MLANSTWCATTSTCSRFAPKPRPYRWPNFVDNQFYRLAYWRVAEEELNYRRFFDVDTLAAIRVEKRDVFASSHALLVELHVRGT